MRQILWRRELRADRWRYPQESGAGPRVLELSEFSAAAGATPFPDGSAGVRVGPADDVLLLAPWLRQLALVVVQFEASGDGRGHSQGQLLRRRLGYAGELRAAGPIRRDQLFLLARCGFDSFELDPAEDARAALAHFGRYSVAYQHAADTLLPLRQRC